MATIPNHVDVLILGGGPTGVEAAIAARTEGFETALFERGEIGDSVLRWGHVRLFSPWHMNRSARGETVLREADVSLEPPDDHPTGVEVVERYLVPLAVSPLLAETVFQETEALAVSRRDLLKGDIIGYHRRADQPFRVRWRH